MLEMVYKGKNKNDKGEERKRLPKNVRQIGEVGNGKKIYLEDYAITYLHQVRAAVLLGEVWEREDGKYLFIHGAIQVDDPEFGDGVWEEVYRQTREYFEDSEILGWALQVSEPSLFPSQEMNEVYREHFDREDAVLLLYEPSEKEDMVFVEENGALKRIDGYYIYYEKNKSMQEYMVSRNQGKSVEKEAPISDNAIKSFRKITEEKRNREEKEPEVGSTQPKSVRFLYAASAFLVLTILVIGVTMMNNYDKMKNMELALSDLANTTDAQEVGNQALALSTETESEEKAAWGEQSTEPEMSEITTEAVDGEETETAENGMEKMTEEQETDVPETVMSETQPTAAQPVHSSQAAYTVREGDTLADICRMYYGGTDRMEEICSLNGIIDPNHILPGQTLQLP